MVNVLHIYKLQVNRGESSQLICHQPLALKKIIKGIKHSSMSDKDVSLKASLFLSNTCIGNTIVIEKKDKNTSK